MHPDRQLTSAMAGTSSTMFGGTTHVGEAETSSDATETTFLLPSPKQETDSTEDSLVQEVFVLLQAAAPVSFDARKFEVVDDIPDWQKPDLHGLSLAEQPPASKHNDHRTAGVFSYPYHDGYWRLRFNY